MRIDYHRKFKKALRKQPARIQTKFFKAIELFLEDQFHPSLNSYTLSGDLSGVRSFNVTGDVRVHYKMTKEGIILLNIGTHNQLY